MPYSCSLPVSYTHLDVYKRQSLLSVEQRFTQKSLNYLLHESDIKKLLQWSLHHPLTTAR